MHVVARVTQVVAIGLKATHAEEEQSAQNCNGYLYSECSIVSTHVALTGVIKIIISIMSHKGYVGIYKDYLL